VSNVLSKYHLIPRYALFINNNNIPYTTMHAGTFNRLWENLTGIYLLYLGHSWLDRLDWWLFLSLCTLRIAREDMGVTKRRNGKLQNQKWEMASLSSKGISGGEDK